MARVAAGAPQPPAVRARRGAREALALDLLERGNARQRIRGLGILAAIDDADLFEWCAMFLDDEELQVRLAAIRTMHECRQIEPDVLEPLARSENKRVRAAAVAVLARHGGPEAERWYERGLRDPEPCVRTATARLLKLLDPKRHRRLFDLARYDPNPQIEALAKRLTTTKSHRRVGPRPRATRR